jgi:hypothetical protein
MRLCVDAAARSGSRTCGNQGRERAGRDSPRRTRDRRIPMRVQSRLEPQRRSVDEGLDVALG